MVGRQKSPRLNLLEPGGCGHWADGVSARDLSPNFLRYTYNIED